VEITALLPLANLERFNAAFGIGLAGFSDLMVCVLRPEPAPSLGWNWHFAAVRFEPAASSGGGVVA
jgi:hypothetical protein